MVDTPADARREVADLARAAPDVVKIVYDHQSYGGRTMRTVDLPTLTAVLGTAREHGLKTVVHVGTWEDIRQAATAGADAVTHTPGPDPLPADLADVLVRTGTSHIPTLAVQSDFARMVDDPALLDDPLLVETVPGALLDAYRGAGSGNPRIEGWLARQRTLVEPNMEAVRMLAAAGVPILAGTDGGNFGVFQGYSVHRELELLHEAGLSPWAAVRSATTNAARFLDRRWGVEPGDEATLLVLDASPIESISEEGLCALLSLQARDMLPICQDPVVTEPKCLSREARLLLSTTLLAALIPACGPAGETDLPGLAEIREPDLRRDIELLAGDGMRGREAGTIDELRASAWIADQAREAGLGPAGDDGTYFQFWPIRRTRISRHSSVAVEGSRLALWRDAVVMQPVAASIDGRLVDIGATPAEEVAAARIEGRPVVARLLPPDTMPDLGAPIGEVRYTWSGVAQRAQALVAKGASAVVVVGDSVSERAFDWIAAWQSRGSFELDTAPRTEPVAGVPVVLVREALGAALTAGSRLQAGISVDSFRFPSVNVIAKVPGADRDLADEYVLFSAHQDHDGVRYPAEGDSIWNGADDNASASVALLAIGRAFAAAPARRSALFVWHGAEEKGLLGSRWHASNPVVPPENIVAVLNADMIGRNHPDTASLLGAQPPHRNSPELVAMALEANRETAGFVVDSLWDSPDHPEGFYFRSDHLPYARAGIPALFFTSVLHPDYHTERDEPAGIDIAKLAGIARWMYATAWAAANAHMPPALDPDFELER